MRAHHKQRIILDIKEEWRDFFGAIFKPIGEEFDNIVLRLPEINKSNAPAVQKSGLPYFSKQVAIEWELFYELAHLGVSDIYIGEQLGFELDKVAAAAAKYKVRTRIYPNVAQSARAETDPLKKFFMRPEDTDIYNRRYISTFEFYMPEEIDLNWDVLYRAYAINKNWHGPLNEIILGLDHGINNTYLSPRWSETRMSCARKCLKGRHCEMCNTLYELSKSIANMEVMPKRSTDTKATAKQFIKNIDSKQLDKEPYPPPKFFNP